MNGHESADRLEHAIPDGDIESTDSKIGRYTGEVPWSYLKPHGERGNLLWVDPALDLRHVARAFVEDQGSRVADWLGNGDLVRVGGLHAAQWEGTDQRFMAAVVMPFVLMQEMK